MHTTRRRRREAVPPRTRRPVKKRLRQPGYRDVSEAFEFFDESVLAQEPLTASRFGDPVRDHDERLARRQHRLGGFESGVRERAEQPGGLGLDEPDAALTDHGRGRVRGVAVAQVTGASVEHREEGRGELIDGGESVRQGVQPVEALSRVTRLEQIGADSIAHERRQPCRPDSLARDVADDKCYQFAVQVDDVVEVTAHARRR